MRIKPKKKKISKEDKNLIIETVNSIIALRNSGARYDDDDDDELDGFINSNDSYSRKEERSNSAVWKTLAFVLFGILILFATDVIEFKRAGSQKGSVVKKQDAPAGKETKEVHPVGGQGESVETNETDPAGKETNEVHPIGGQGESVETNETAPPVKETKEVHPVGGQSDSVENKKTAPPAKETKEVEPENLVTMAKRQTYKTRGQPMSEKDRKAMEDKWGTWTLKADTKDRPTDDYYAAYPNRDVPRAKFPPNAWQTDKEWLSKFLPESIKLVDRAINAILEEYGQPLDGKSDLFHVEKYDQWVQNMEKEHCHQQSGCTTVKSFENLRRRLLHAVMTEDVFVFAMGGHSSSAGHGNHFTQSYTLQVQWILEAVFSRLGVRHQSRNIGLGGLGTTQTGIATKQILGHDVDVLMWDSGMTEKEAEARDMFFRQGILGGGKVPMLMAASPRNNVMSMLNKNVDADILMVGEQTVLSEANSLDEVKKLPWALQYVRCGSEISGICRDNEYMGQCWIERDDFEPPTKQGNVEGRAKWHPGNRKHQIIGRSIAFIILEALKDALTVWNDAKDYNLADDAWHVTSIYDNTRSKVEMLGPTVGTCHKYKEKFTDFMCNTAVKARVEFTPRAYPDFTNIRTLMPPSQAEQINDPPETIYDAPDVFNPNLHPPTGAVDVLNIVEAGTPFTPVLVPDYTHFYPKPKFEKEPLLPIGKGYYLDTNAGFCDGSVDSWCKRQADNKCQLYGHNDGRKGILMDSYCGWMVTNLPEVKYGFIALKIETWHAAKSNPKTKSWTSMNNESRKLYDEQEGSFLRSSSSSSSRSMNSSTYHDGGRQLKAKVPDYCPEFKFEFAIDGKITSWDYEKYMEHMAHIQRVVEIVKIVEDPSITGGAEKEIEFAFRINGCKNEKTMQLTHIYWA